MPKTLFYKDMLKWYIDSEREQGVDALHLL